MTTGEVCAEIVKPASASRACAYVELLRGAGPREGATLAAVGPATVFVSHAWGNPFRDMLAAVAAHLAAGERAATGIRGQQAGGDAGAGEGAGEAAGEGAEVFLWVDIFVVNQHAAGELPQEWWAQTFRQAVAGIGHTLVVLQPWSAPAPLTRSWCLWEVFSTLDSGAKLHVALAPAQRGAFPLPLVRGGAQAARGACVREARCGAPPAPCRSKRCVPGRAWRPVARQRRAATPARQRERSERVLRVVPHFPCLTLSAHVASALMRALCPPRVL
jgi:hypothetical protein